MKQHPTIETLIDKLIKQCSKCPSIACLKADYTCPLKEEVKRQLDNILKGVV